MAIEGYFSPVKVVRDSEERKKEGPAMKKALLLLLGTALVVSLGIQTPAGPDLAVLPGMDPLIEE